MRKKAALGLAGALFACLTAGAAHTLLGTCGPFTDVSDVAFCPFVLEIFTLGITTGTMPTTYDPSSNVTRLQMAAFLSRTVDGVLTRGSARAARGRFWPSQGSQGLAVTTLAWYGGDVKSDGSDLWVASYGLVSRVRASDGRVLETWDGDAGGTGVLVALGQIFVGGWTKPGSLYRLDPSQPAGTVTTLSTALGDSPYELTFDGTRIWTANQGGSVSIVTPGATLPWTVTTVTAGFSVPSGAIYDGSNVWIAELNPGRLVRLDANGAILQTVTCGGACGLPAFDGTNLWVPAFELGNSFVLAVRASTGAVLATLTGNGVDEPQGAAFDGQRVMVISLGTTAGSLSLFKAADLSPLGSISTGFDPPQFVCSDGVDFWVTFGGSYELARF